MRILISCLFAFVLAGCSATGVLNALSPEGSLRITRDVAYGPGARHRLDIYAPDDARQAPVVFFVYGGSWDSGSRQDYAFVGSALARRGFVAVIADYRLYPEVRFPGFLEDGAEGIAWTKRHVRAFGGDPAKLVLLGHSAGAYNTAMLALDPEWLRAVGLDPRRDLAGNVGLAGPYDFKLDDHDVRQSFGPPIDFARTQPVRYVRPGAPPMLLGVAETDDEVQPRNSETLAARLRSAGDRVTLVRYPNLSHRTLVGVIAAPLQGLAPVLDDIERFVRQVTGTPAPRS